MIHKITLAKGEVITKDNLTKLLNDARSTYNYAKFTFYNNVYITIVYNRDQTIEIATNSRDIALWNQIQSIRSNYSQMRVINYVFDWINRLNK